MCYNEKVKVGNRILNSNDNLSKKVERLLSSGIVLS